MNIPSEFIEAIDAVDTGISQYPSEEKPRYRSRTDLSSRVGWLNPAWNVPVDAQTVDVRGASDIRSVFPTISISRSLSRHRSLPVKNSLAG